MPAHPPIQVRLDPEYMDLIEQLQAHLGSPGMEPNRAQIIRRGIRLLAETEGLIPKTPTQTKATKKRERS